MNIQKLFIIFLLTFSCLNNAGPEKISLDSAMHKLCCFLFGSETACQNVQTYFDNAAQHFPALIHKKIPLKYIKPNSLLNKYTSFTWFGTWINKDSWHTATPEQKEWLALHELAHTAYNHPIKQIFTLLATTAFSLYATKKFKMGKIPATLTTASLATLTYSALSRIYEKEADIKVAKILQEQNKEKVIQYHIDDLSQEQNTFNLFFYSPTTQIQYLVPFLPKKPINS